MSGIGSNLDLTGYALTFDEEFNSYDLNNGGTQPGVWNTYFTGYNVRTLSGNGEQEFYSDPSVGVNPFSQQNGELTITASPGSNSAGLPYNSGAITTEGTFSQTYGYFEMRAELPQGQGMWPAFWLLPTSNGWPPELDVLEAFGQTNANGEGGSNSYHVNEISGNSSQSTGSWESVPANIYNSYNTYGVMWTPTNVTYYFDGKEVAQFTTPSDMNQAMYLIANLAVGGNWPGNAAGETGQMKIDYIRAFSSDSSATAVNLQTVSAPDGNTSADMADFTSGATAANVSAGQASATPTPAASPTPAPTPSPSPSTASNPTPSPSPSTTSNPTPSPSPSTASDPSTTSSPTPTPAASPTPAPTPSPSPSTASNPTPSPSPSTASDPSTTSGPTPTPTPSSTPAPSPVPAPTPSPSPSTASNPTPSPSPSTASDPSTTSGLTPTPAPSPTPAPTPSPSPSTSSDPSTTSSPTLTPAPSPTPAPTASPDPTPSPSPSTAGNPSTTSDPTPSPSPTPASDPTPTPHETRVSVAPDATGTATGGSSPSILTATAAGQTLIGNGGDDIFSVGSFANVQVVETGKGISEVDTTAPVYALPTGINNLLATDNGNHVLIGNGGNNVITGGTGNDVIDSGGGTAILTGGGGNDTFVMQKGYVQDTITDFHPATDVLDLHGYAFTSVSQVEAALTQSGQNTVLTLTDGGTVVFDNVTVGQLTAADFALGPTPTPQETRLSVAPDSTGTATGTSSPSTLTATADGQTLIGNGGDDVFSVGSFTHIQIIENGQGISEVDTTAASYTLPAGIKNLLATDNGNHVLIGNGENNIITGGTGNDVIDSGGGTAILTGGGGSDTFVMNKGYAEDTITDFHPATDVVDLNGYGITDVNSLGADLSQHGADTWLVLPDGGKVIFQNTQMSALTPADFALDASGTGSSTQSPSPTPSTGDSGSPSPAPTPSPTSSDTTPVIPDPAAHATPSESRGFVTPDSSGTANGDSSQPDVLYATGSHQTLVGNGGDDVFIIGSHGDTTVSETGQGTATVITSAHDYTLPTGIADLTGIGTGEQILTGNSGNNYITGNNGNDVITAGSGNDTIAVGTGHNILAAGAGQDLFVFGNAADQGNVITNFHVGQDELDLIGVLKSINYQGTDPIADHTLQFIQEGSNTAVVVDPNGTATGGHTVVTLDNVTASSLKAGHDYIWHA